MKGQYHLLGLLFLCSFFIASHSCLSQTDTQTPKYYTELVSMINRSDVFALAQGSILLKAPHAYLSFSLGCGLGKTFFQSRFSPTSFIQYAHEFLHTKSYRLAVAARYQYNVFKVDKLYNRYTDYMDASVGLAGSWGKEWSFTHQVMLGQVWEGNYSLLTNARNYERMLSYQLSIGIRKNL